MKSWARRAVVSGFAVLFAVGFSAGCVQQGAVVTSTSDALPQSSSGATGGSEPAATTGRATGDEAKATVPDTAPATPQAPATGDEKSETQKTQPAADENAKPPEPGNEPPHPYPHRVAVPDFPKDLEWLNVAAPLRQQDLRGKFVLLDFWTYCCINCMHILPELKKLEREFPDQLVVIGVHSAKFETEKGAKNIEEAILRYEIEHPVVNDADHRIWDTYGVRSWPSVILIDPEGNAVWGRPGEIQAEEVEQVIRLGLPYYRERKTLDETPIRFELAAHVQHPTPLRFPGKVLADEAGRRLFIADSNHNRIVVAALDGKLLATIGAGTLGRTDGDFAAATFDHPQGMALVGDVLYVADTENHMLRKVDLRAQRVTTIAGTGAQGRGWPGFDRLAPGDEPPARWVGKPLATDINSPWDLWIHNDQLYIAMAGPHQIWKMRLDESEIGPYAGNSREDIVDGPLLPRIPYEEGYSSFAQPSGLSSDGEWLYVADSEGSSIRAVPFDPNQKVRTVVGTAELPYNRLFSFGDKDGPREEVLLQHCLGVAYRDGQLYVADTYNNKIKIVDAKTGAAKTLAGTGKPGSDDAAGEFDEPAGIAWCQGLLYVADTNNHKIRTVDPATGKVTTLEIAGLQPPAPAKVASRPDFSRAPQVAVDPVAVRATDGRIMLSAVLQLPTGWKINDRAPMRYWIEAVGNDGPVDRTQLREGKVDPPASEFRVSLPVTGTGRDELRLMLVYYYCQDGGEGLCKVGSVVWNVPVTIEATASAESVLLKYQVAE